MNERQEIVRAYLSTVVRKRWSWGTVDCAQFAAGMIYALSGKNFGNVYSYDSKPSCDKVLREHGGVVKITTRHLGSPCAFWAICKDGDIVMAELEYGDTLGIALPSKGDGEAMFKHKGYVMNIPLADCSLFWRVPCQV